MDFSIIIPVYNSIESLPILMDEINAYFRGSSYGYEVIFVNDASRDETKRVLDRIKHAACEANVKVIHLSENVGQQKALAYGLLEAVGTYALTMDDDLQHDIRSLEHMMVCALQGSDLTFGIYKEYGEKRSREIGSKVIGLFFKLRYRKLGDKQVSSLKLIHHSVYKKLTLPLKSFVYLSAELVPYSKNIGNVHVKRRQRLYGKSGYTLLKCIQIGLKLTLYYGLMTQLWEGVGKYETHPNGRRGQLSDQCNQEDQGDGTLCNRSRL